MKKDFKNCSVCGKKISWFRKMRMKQLDKDPLHMVPLSQFCSNECAEKGLKIILKNVNNGRLNKR